MNKKLYLLPLLAGLVMVGCDNEKDKPNGNNNNNNPPVEETAEPDGVDVGPAEFGGYRMVLVPEEGKEYILGMYSTELKQMMFVNGQPHKDDNGTYPFYMACNLIDETETEVDAGAGAAKFSVEYTSKTDNDEQMFRIKIDDTSVDDCYYHGYMHIYGDKVGSSVKTSLKFDTNVNATYDNKLEGDAHNAEVPCSNEFYLMKNWYSEGTAYRVNALVTDFENACYKTNSYGSQPVAIGTYGSMVSLSASTYNRIKENYKAHFYEKIAD